MHIFNKSMENNDSMEKNLNEYFWAKGPQKPLVSAR